MKVLILALTFMILIQASIVALNGEQHLRISQIPRQLQAQRKSFVSSNFTGVHQNNDFSQLNITDAGTGNIFVGGSVIGSQNGTVLLKATGSNNKIGSVIVLGQTNSSVFISVTGDHNTIAGMTITASNNSVTMIQIIGSYNSLGGVTTTTTNTASLSIKIIGNNSVITGGTFTASGTSSIFAQLNQTSTMTGVTVTASQQAKIDLILNGSALAVTGLTLTAGGYSFQSFNMPQSSIGYADTGRTITTSGLDSICLYFPKSKSMCIPVDKRY